MRGVGAVLLGVGVLLAVIAGAWGRSGFYAEQAPILLILALGALICLGAGAAMVRYRKAGFTSSAMTISAADSSTAANRNPTWATTVLADPRPPHAALSRPSVNAEERIDEKTRDRVVKPGDWTVVLPDGTVLPITDGLVIGRHPVSSDGAATAAVPSTEVSKSHARFRVVGGLLGVRDLDTTNGTFVVHADEREERVSSTAETALGPGDRLEIGSYVLEVKRRS